MLSHIQRILSLWRLHQRTQRWLYGNSILLQLEMYIYYYTVFMCLGVRPPTFQKRPRFLQRWRLVFLYITIESFF